jgi:hypothetical protein
MDAKRAAAQSALPKDRPVSERARLSACRKIIGFLKGHDFSRAENILLNHRALAPEGCRELLARLRPNNPQIPENPPAKPRTNPPTHDPFGSQ